VPIKWRFFVPKFVDIEPGLLELFENVTGVRFFFRHSVYYILYYLAPFQRYCRLSAENSESFLSNTMLLGPSEDHTSVPAKWHLIPSHDYSSDATPNE